MGLALVKDLRQLRAPLGAEEIEQFATLLRIWTVARLGQGGRGASRVSIGCGARCAPT